jgi:hypothetical protein
MSKEAKRLTLDEFLSSETSSDVSKLAESFNGGSFMCCHTHIFAETGIWIDELVPVFRKLDAQLAVNNDRTVSALVKR